LDAQKTVPAAQAIGVAFVETFKDFPPRLQSFNLDQVPEQLKASKAD
jgi:hypothetical protein